MWVAVVLVCYAAISLLVWACCMVAGMADDASERLLERERELDDLPPGSDRQSRGAPAPLDTPD